MGRRGRSAETTAARVLFIGGTRRGFMTLEALLDHGAPVCGVISLRQDDHEIDRFEDAIEALCRKNRTTHYSTRWMKDRDFASIIADELKPDIAVVVGCRILIPKTIYELPALGTMAVHDSLLPAYRGFAPLNWSLVNGESSTGVTLFKLSDEMDAGPIVAQQTVPIGSHDTAPMIYERVCNATVNVVLSAYDELRRGKTRPQSQDHRHATFTCSRTPADGLIDWTRSTTEIFDLVRALTHPYPGAYTFLDLEKVVILDAIPAPEQRPYVGRIPGRVVAMSRDDGYVDVLTGDGILRIRRVQLADAGPTTATDVIKSIRATLGVHPLELVGRIKALENAVQALGRNNSPDARSARSPVEARERIG
jgi:methionyl-tRNA formyltransferase